ncbi:uncharacterized protein LOC119265150 [Pygocentrus nattereri]|uniref:uncharacterized protein LOC119265150 n=1 Tax=Pygocentrus nattereri TaxID=42514 RepID=UPI0018912F59|nr:uncharacterized protein LOC119265150 [Pygocentrus nattereri]
MWKTLERILIARLWRVPDQQRRVDAATQTDDGDHRLLHTACARDGVYQHRDVCSSIPENRQELPFTPPTLCGALARIWFCQGLDRTDKNFAYTCENCCSDGLKLVEVKLQYKSLYNGLESEHWWVVSNTFYNLSTLELPPQYFACASAVACIKRIGASIREVKVYLRTESSQTSVQNIMLQTRVSRTKKCVFIDSDGHFWSHGSSQTHILETPAPSVCPTRPRGPPPGF